MSVAFRVGRLILLGLLVAACDPSSYLAIRNDGDSLALVRFTEEFASSDPFVQVFRIPAHVAGVASPPGIGEIKGTIEILTPSCDVIAVVAAQGGSIATIGSDGRLTIRNSNNNDAPVETGLEAVADCGGIVAEE